MRSAMPSAFALCALTVLALTSPVRAYNFKVIHDFCKNRGCTDGDSPASGLSMDTAGNLYGAAHLSSQSQESAILFELSPAANKEGWKFKRMYSSNNFLGPNGSFVFDVAGNIYGTKSFGGSKGNGQVFELIPHGTHGRRTLKELFSFGQQDPRGFNTEGLTYQGAGSGVLYDGVSTLFGINASGGTTDGGVIFALTPADGSWNESDVYDLCAQAGCADGGNPAGLTIDASGTLYGVAAFGGTNGGGTVFSLVQQSGTWSETTLHEFCASEKCTDGSGPDAPLLQDAAGDFLGVTGRGGEGRKECCGTIFKLTPQGQSSPYSVLTSFCVKRNCNDGAQPAPPLIMDASGNLFGITPTGGPHRVGDEFGGGTVYMMNGTNRIILHSFCSERNCTDGDNPVALVMDASGNLYGVTEGGGKYGAGAVFELTL
jgi:uncharacterized repeat protein (TIGR03803 family)